MHDHPGSDRRRNFRYKVNDHGELSRAGDSKFIRAIVTDFSLGGAQLFSLQPCPSGELMVLHVTDHSTGARLTCHGRVVYCEPQAGDTFTLGFFFVPQTIEERAKINSYLCRRLRDQWSQHTGYAA